MRKKLSLVLSAMILGAALSACGVDEPATQVEAPAEVNAEVTEAVSTEAVGQEEISPCQINGHDFKEATCVEPKTCTVCGETEGEADDSKHEWGLRTVDHPKTCDVCGTTEGDAINITKITPVFESHEGADGKWFYPCRDGYTVFCWGTDSYYDIDVCYVDRHGLDGTLLDAQAYWSDWESDAYGAWIYSADGEIYLALLGMCTYEDVGDTGAMNNKLALHDSHNNIIWSSDKWRRYYPIDLFSNDGQLIVVLMNEDTDDIITVDVETDELVEGIQIPNGTYLYENYDTSKYDYAEKNDASSYTLVANLDRSKWGYIDEQGNELAMYMDATSFVKSGYALVSDDRQSYYIIDSDFNVVSDKIFPGDSAGTTSTVENFFQVSSEGTNPYYVCIE